MKLWKTLGLAVAFLVVAAVGFAGGATYNGFPVVNLAVNGRAVQPEVPAIIMDGRTLVPVRAIAEALGATVRYDQVDNTVFINSQQIPAPPPAPAPVAPPPPPAKKESAREVFDITQTKSSRDSIGIVSITGYVKNISNHGVTNLTLTGVLLDGNGAVADKSLPDYLGNLSAGSEVPFQVKFFSPPSDWARWELNVGWQSQ